MQIISDIEIDHFRSIKRGEIRNLGHFSALAGLNNSGKSNVLRALNAFFTDDTDPGTELDIDQDYYRHDLNRKQTKRIRISVSFNLPNSFKFRKGLEGAKALLGGQNFKITKEWRRAYPDPLYFLNDSPTPLEYENEDKVEQFLALISFRYIPNRVLPLDIIRNEHRALRDVLVRRLAKKAKRQESVFQTIKDTSATLIRSLEKNVHDASPEVGNIRLATPTSWQDLIFAFGYKLGMGGIEVDDSAQGSGIQSLLMLETLSLIDRDYFQKFGWKQAAIWAIEEPESSLHSALEARVASYLSAISSEQAGRLQIIATTHSDLVLQYADFGAFASNNAGTSTFETGNKKNILQKAASLGISRWVHPILADPLNPIVLVEGKYDFEFLSRAIACIDPTSRIRVSYLQNLQGGPGTGGVEALLSYLKQNVNAIRTRIKGAPVIVVIDWDSSGKKAEFEKLFSVSEPYKVFVWPESESNPKLGKSFRGIERFMVDRIIDAADSSLNVIGVTSAGLKTVASADYGRLKEAVSRTIQQGIAVSDLLYAKQFVSMLCAAAT